MNEQTELETPKIAIPTDKAGRPDGLMIALPLLKDMHYLKAILEVLAC